MLAHLVAASALFGGDLAGIAMGRGGKVYGRYDKVQLQQLEKELVEMSEKGQRYQDHYKSIVVKRLEVTIKEASDSKMPERAEWARHLLSQIV